MPLHILQVDPGTEYLVPWARNKFTLWHQQMDYSGHASIFKTVQVSDGSTVYASSLRAGDAFIDKLRITGGANILVRSDDTKYAALTWDCKKVVEYTNKGGAALMACLGTTAVSSATAFGGATYYLANALTGVLIATIPAATYGAYPASGGNYFVVGEKDASHFSIHPRDAASGIATHLTDRALAITSTGPASTIAGTFNHRYGAGIRASGGFYSLFNVVDDTDILINFAAVPSGPVSFNMNRTYIFSAYRAGTTQVKIDVFRRVDGTFISTIAVATTAGTAGLMCLTCDEKNLLCFMADSGEADPDKFYVVKRYTLPALPDLPDLPVFTAKDVSANFNAAVGNGNSVRNQVLIPVINRQF